MSVAQSSVPHNLFPLISLCLVQAWWGHWGYFAVVSLLLEYLGRWCLDVYGQESVALG